MYLIHHGIKGQKWGVRRFENEDGTLTEAGKERYANKRVYADSKFREVLTSPSRSRMARAVNRNMKTFAKENAKNARTNEKGETEYVISEKAARATRRNGALVDKAHERALYDRHTSTGKMFTQNLLMGAYGAEYYRDARARGNTRVQSFVESQLGILVSRKRDIQKYGEIAYSAI